MKMSQWIWPILPLGLSVAAGAPAGQGAFTIASQAFSNGAPIPLRYTCDGENISPPLEWRGVPGRAETLAIIADDPDAPNGTFVHWVFYNLPASTHHLKHGITSANAPDGTVFGVNGRGNDAYTGPCPPSGTHHYHFKLYALDTQLPTGAPYDKPGLLDAMEGHVLAQAELIGTYQRHEKKRAGAR